MRQFPQFCCFQSGINVVHLAFGSLVARALMEKPTIFPVSRIRKVKLGNGYSNEWRMPGREEKGHRQRIPKLSLPIHISG